MYFWEKVAEAGGVLKEFKEFLEFKNTYTAPLCASSCKARCCGCDQIDRYYHVLSNHSADSIDKPLVNAVQAITNTVRTCNPDHVWGCSYLSNNRCWIEEYKPKVCMEHFCSDLFGSLDRKHARELSGIRYSLFDNLCAGLNKLGGEKRKYKHITEKGATYYYQSVLNYLNSKLESALEEWKKSSKFPPIQWHDHAIQVIEYSNSISMRDQSGWRDLRRTDYYQAIYLGPIASAYDERGLRR